MTLHTEADFFLVLSIASLIAAIIKGDATRFRGNSLETQSARQ